MVIRKLMPSAAVVIGITVRESVPQHNNYCKLHNTRGLAFSFSQVDAPRIKYSTKVTLIDQ